MSPYPLLTFVRPGPNAFTWLGALIADLKGADPFQPVTVLVPNDYSGRFVRWHLSRSGGYANVFTERLLSLARALLPEPAAGGDLWPVLERGAVRAALAQHPDAFGGLAHASLQAALLELFREARRAEVDLDVVLGAGDAGKYSQAARDAARVHRTYVERIASYDNNTDQLRRAAATLEHAEEIPPRLARWGALILFLPTRLDPGEVRFLAAAARFVPLVVGLIQTGDRREAGDKLSREMAEQLAEALDVARLEPDSSAREETGHRPVSTTNDAQSAEAPVAALRVIRAPDPAEEVREVVRRVVAEVQAGVPLYRMAILYRQNDPYADLVRDALAWAGLPWVSSEGRRLAETRSGRSLIRLLGLRDRQFSREAVLEWLDTGPRPDFPEEIPPDAVWVRLTRAANVTRGEAEWASRLAAHAKRLAVSLPAGEVATEAVSDDGRNPETRHAATRRALAQTNAIARLVAALARDLQPPEVGASWSEYVNWVRKLRDRYIGAPERWPAEGEREAAVAVDGALARLGAGDEIGGDRPTPASFREAVGAALEEERLPTGELGRGILIEPVAAVTGLWFKRIFILGMTEGAFPPPPGVDPFFPEEEADPLRRRERQRQKERRDFLAALAAVEGTGGVLTLSAPDAADRRASFPSRWLLEAIQTYRGVAIPGTRFGTFGATASSDWLASVNSSHHAVLREVAPADLEDYRLQRVARWATAGRSLAEHPLARPANSPLGRAMRLVRERGSFRFTEFDGNLTALVGTPRLGAAFRQARPISASALQTWAVCGYRYFLSYVLRVEPTEDPENRGTIDALERGSLVHQVLEWFFQALRQDGRPAAHEEYTARDHELLQELARQAFAEVEARGVTGHALDWEVTRRVLLADLREFLEQDTRWRKETGLAPHHLEQGFGGTAGWPSLELLVDGERLAFRGFVDRIDRNGDGDVYVTDYKTGSGKAYEGIAADPVLAGQHLQLALYNRAARANLPDASSVSSSFWFVTSAGGFRRVAVESSPAVDQRLADVLGIITRGIRGGVFPLVPGGEGQRGPENCVYCDYNRICPIRRDLLAQQKAGDPAAGIHRTLVRGDGGGMSDD